MRKFCMNCGAPATCEHHIVPLVLGGNDIPSNKASLCDTCHSLIHGVTFEKGGMSHSELVKAGQQRKREAIARGEKYERRRANKGMDFIGRPKITKLDIPEEFEHIYFTKQYKNITDLAKKCQMSRTTVYRYIALLTQ